MRIAVYVRVSGHRQVQTQTIEQQLERLQSHSQHQGWSWQDEHVFRDDGYTGAVEPHYAVKREGVVEKTSIHWHTVAYANTDRADGRVETILPE